MKPGMISLAASALYTHVGVTLNSLVQNADRLDYQVKTLTLMTRKGTTTTNGFVEISHRTEAGGGRALDSPEYWTQTLPPFAGVLPFEARRSPWAGLRHPRARPRA